MKKINYWSDEKEKIDVSCKLPSCLAKDYFVPSINKILTKIKPDHQDFVPKYSDSSCADIVANTPEGLVLAQKTSALIDCGFFIEKPIGYKIRIITNINLAQKGFYLEDHCVETGRVEITAFNNGQESIFINHKQVIGQMYIEPVYLFEWETS